MAVSVVQVMRRPVEARAVVAPVMILAAAAVLAGCVASPETEAPYTPSDAGGAAETLGPEAEPAGTSTDTFYLLGNEEPMVTSNPLLARPARAPFGDIKWHPTAAPWPWYSAGHWTYDFARPQTVEAAEATLWLETSGPGAASSVSPWPSRPSACGASAHLLFAFSQGYEIRHACIPPEDMVHGGPGPHRVSVQWPALEPPIADVASVSLWITVTALAPPEGAAFLGGTQQQDAHIRLVGVAEPVQESERRPS